MKNKPSTANEYSDNESISDYEIDPKEHQKLVNNILNLNKKQRVDKPTRTEPSNQVSEFNLLNTDNSKHGIVQVNDLTKTFDKNAILKSVNKKLKKYEVKKKTLPKPLEKPQADRIRRSVGYLKARLELDRWDAVVAAHRGAEHIRFPLNTDLKLKASEREPFSFRLKSDLQKQIEANKPKVEIINVEQEDKVPLTMKEIMEKRKEAAKLRAHMSFKEAKARKQNKIKSKKYHRIQRREKIKKQLQEFELLQKTNPEAALQKLEEIEKARAEERISLRHKGTGKWAKNKQVRAKYDKESRKVLAQQLSISKDLTQKVKLVESSDSENDDMNTMHISSENNPWTGVQKNKTEVDEFLSEYKKFWNEQNKINQEKPKTNSKISKEVIKYDENINLDNIQAKLTTEMQELDNAVQIPKKTLKGDNKIKKKKKLKPATKIYSTSSVWNVTSASIDIEKAFDEYENNLAKTLNEKYAKLKKKLKKVEKTKKKTSKPKMATTFDLSLAKQAKRPVIDEELIMNSDDEQQKIADDLVATLNKKILTSNEPEQKIMKPNREVKIIQLNTKIPDLLVTDDNENDLAQKEAIAGAFEDEDVVDEFNKEKQDDINKNKPKDIDLTLPGWGSWGGTNIPLTKKKRKRFIIKMPKEVKRRDENKGNVIIFEGGNKQIKNHLVSDLPFPFKTVKDFEASIRQPLGTTFVPETAFKKLTLPPIKTKLGAIIKPLSEDILLKKKYAI